MGGAVVAVIIRREKEAVAHFRSRRAVSPSTAQSLGALQLEDNRTLHRLLSRAVIREGTPGAYYLDEPSWEALRRTRRRIVTIMLVLIVAAFVAVLLTTQRAAQP